MEEFTNDEINYNNSEDIYSISSYNENINNQTSEENLFNLTEVENHIVVNTRNQESSTDSLKIKLNDINFSNNDNKSILTSFFSVDELNNMDFKEIYTIICESQMIIFVDNYKLVKEHSTISNCFRRKINLIKEEFPGCTFFPFEYISELKKNIHILNNNILQAELKHQKVYFNDDICYSICFDEGEILKKVLYKKMEVVNKILFVPINKYQLKQTE